MLHVRRMFPLLIKPSQRKHASFIFTLWLVTCERLPVQFTRKDTFHLTYQSVCNLSPRCCAVSWSQRMEWMKTLTMTTSIPYMTSVHGHSRVRYQTLLWCLRGDLFKNKNHFFLRLKLNVVFPHNWFLSLLFPLFIYCSKKLYKNIFSCLFSVVLQHNMLINSPLNWTLLRTVFTVGTIMIITHNEGLIIH